MNKARILKALLFIINEAGGVTPPQLDRWLGELYSSKVIDNELRKVGGCQTPYWVMTDAGREKLK